MTWILVFNEDKVITPMEHAKQCMTQIIIKSKHLSDTNLNGSPLLDSHDSVDR